MLAGDYREGKARIDTLDLVALGAEVHLQAVADTQQVSGSLRATLTDSTLLRRFGGEALADADAGLDLRLDVAGPWPIPGVDLALDAWLKLPDLDLPRLEARARGDADGLMASVAAPRGLWAGTTEVDSLRLGWRGRFVAADSLTFGFDAGAFSPLGMIQLGGQGGDGPDARGAPWIP